MKKVSAIIVNWNDKEVTAECVQSLLDQDHSELEIIVSDNGSTDGSADFLTDKFPNVHLIENGYNLGFGSAVNRGFAAASGDYLLFLNNDLVVEQNSITALVNLLESDEQIGGAVPKILYFEHRDTINSLGVLIHFTGVACPYRVDEKDTTPTGPFETACGGIFMIPRKVYEIVGGFDEDLFLYHEDHDLSWRIRLQGLKLVVAPGATFYHHYQFNKGLHKYYYSEKNRLHLLLKNMAAKTLLLISPALVLVEIAQWIHSVLNGWFFLKLKSYGELTAMLFRIYKKRQSLQSRRRSTDKEIVRLYQGNLAVTGMNSRLLDKILNPVLNGWWNLIRGWI